MCESKNRSRSYSTGKNNLISNTQTFAEYGIRGDLLDSSTYMIRNLDIKGNTIYGYIRGVSLINCYSLDFTDNNFLIRRALT